MFKLFDEGPDKFLQDKNTIQRVTDPEKLKQLVDYLEALTGYQTDRNYDFLYSHPSCILHDPGSMHPECPERLKAVLEGLNDKAFKSLQRHEAPKIDVRQVELVHTPYYVQNIIETSPEKGRVQLDADTLMSSHSLEAAMRSSGAAVEAVDRVMAGDAKNVFCAVHPPGHHAEGARAMGFCLFNGAAIAEFHARSAHSVDRVAVIDFDVHNGNGTQNSFEQEPSLFYASSHQSPAYPGQGMRMRLVVLTTYAMRPCHRIWV